MALYTIDSQVRQFVRLSYALSFVYVLISLLHNSENTRASQFCQNITVKVFYSRNKKMILYDK